MKATLARDVQISVEREESAPSIPLANIANNIPIPKLIIIYSESFQLTLLVIHYSMLFVKSHVVIIPVKCCLDNFM